jgi:hypothetical protein
MAITERFRVRDAAGKQYDAVCVQKPINTTHNQSSHSESIFGLPEYKLSTGGGLSMIDHDTFEVVATGKKVTRVR